MIKIIDRLAASKAYEASFLEAIFSAVLGELVFGSWWLLVLAYIAHERLLFFVVFYYNVKQHDLPVRIYEGGRLWNFITRPTSI